MCLAFVIMLVLSPSPLIPPAARNRRSARVSPESAREVGDDMWGRVVSDSVFQNGIFPFSDLNE